MTINNEQEEIQTINVSQFKINVITLTDHTNYPESQTKAEEIFSGGTVQTTNYKLRIYTL